VERKAKVWQLKSDMDLRGPPGSVGDAIFGPLPWHRGWSAAEGPTAGRAMKLIRGRLIILSAPIYYLVASIENVASPSALTTTDI
jgi:hypothetical protein